MRLKMRSSVDLPQPDGPMSAVTCFSGDVDADALQRLEAAVVEVEVARGRACGGAGAAVRRCGQLRTSRHGEWRGGISHGTPCCGRGSRAKPG